MGTLEQGVPYTDGTTDQVTAEVQQDAIDLQTAAAEAATDALIDAGLGIGDLPTVDIGAVGPRVTPDSLFVILQDGVAYQITAQQFGGFVSGTDNGRTITGADTLTPADTSIISNSASDHNLAVCALTEAQLIGHMAVPVLQIGTGEVTVVNGTASSVTVTGTGRAKSRNQYSRILVVPWLNFSGTTLWTVTGDTANA